MRLAVLKERRPAETRVAATPETVKKYIALGLTVAVEAGAGLAAPAFRMRNTPPPAPNWRLTQRQPWPGPASSSRSAPRWAPGRARWTSCP